jgi:hypothetical protein
MINEVLVAVPLFVFMGMVLEKSGIAERLLTTMGLAAKRFADERYSWRAFVDKLTEWAAEIQHRLAGDQP